EKKKRETEIRETMVLNGQNKFYQAWRSFQTTAFRLTLLSLGIIETLIELASELWGWSLMALSERFPNLPFLENFLNPRLKGYGYEPEDSHQIDLGLRLVAEPHPSGKGLEIFWLDENKHKYQMICLSQFQGMSTVVPCLEDIYDVKDFKIKQDAFQMSEMELAEWLEGWNLDLLSNDLLKSLDPQDQGGN
ncbi:MAG: hypothetical protein K2X66_17570, partial [Cyanobacteria bacterium]|nr:hypothetical protein [Cyanobacteriota bacterium]